MKIRFAFCAASCLLGIAWACATPRGALAQETAAAVPDNGTVPGYLVEVNGDEPTFEAERVAARLAQELGAPVWPARSGDASRAAGVITISWRPSRGELAVAFSGGGRGVISRVIAAPAAADEALEAAALLAGNLARDEVSELLGPPPPATLGRPTPAPETVVEAPPPPPARPFALATFSLVHPVATNADTPEVRTRLNMNLIYGRVGQLEGLQLGGFGLVSGDVLGAQMSFLGNVAGGRLEGLQLAFGFNWSGGGVSGLQAALLSNGAGPIAGFQTAFASNWSTASVQGGQISLALNVAQGPLVGLQASMGVNVTASALTGVQGGAINVAGDVKGLQVGFINVAKKVKGVQLGLVNVADDVEGVPLGLVSVTKTGGVHPVFWFASETPYNLAVKFSTRFTYTALTASAGKDETNGNVEQIGPGYLVGVRIPLSPLVFETDLGATFLFGGKACCVSSREGLVDDRLLARGRALLSMALHRRLSLFIGAGATVAVRFHQGLEDETTSDLLPELYAGLSL